MNLHVLPCSKLLIKRNDIRSINGKNKNTVEYFVIKLISIVKMFKIIDEQCRKNYRRTLGAICNKIYNSRSEKTSTKIFLVCDKKKFFNVFSKEGLSSLSSIGKIRLLKIEIDLLPLLNELLSLIFSKFIRNLEELMKCFSLQKLQ